MPGPQELDNTRIENSGASNFGAGQQAGGSENFPAIAPPPVRVETVPQPRAGFVWAPGYWDYRGHDHIWVGGRWVHERPGFRWVPDRWEQRGPHWHHAQGHWER